MSAASDAGLPEVVGRYQAAHDRRETDAALAAFSPDARVVDDGQEFNGTDEIRQWLATGASEFTFTRMFVRAEPSADGSWLVVNHLEGNFPGGVVDLRYQFTLTDGDARIAELVIAP